LPPKEKVALSMHKQPNLHMHMHKIVAIEIYNNFGDICLFSEYIPPKKSTKNVFLSFFLSFFSAYTYENKGLDVNVLREQFPSQ
jgi:hypothetical protein